jgi:hypothetical protein
MLVKKTCVATAILLLPVHWLGAEGLVGRLAALQMKREPVRV